MEIVDIHCHAAGIGAGGSGCFVSPALARNWRFGIYLRSFGFNRRELETRGDALVIEQIAAGLAASREVGRAVVLALDGVTDGRGDLDRERTELCVPNEFVARETARHPNLLFGASVNPGRRDAPERLAEAAAAGAVLLKWLPAIQLIDPADRRHIPFYRRLADLGLPLLTHTGSERSFTRARPELCDPARLRLPLECGVRVIAAHAATCGRSGGEANLDRLRRLMAEFPALYADISSLTQFNKFGHLARVLRHGDLHDRLVYGSDFPLTATALVSPLTFLGRLPLGTILAVSRLASPWDRDVALKRALGVPEAVFGRTSGLLRLSPCNNGINR